MRVKHMVLKKITYIAGYLVKADCTGLSSNASHFLPQPPASSPSVSVKRA